MEAHSDIPADLRAQMSRHRIDSAYVAALLGRTRQSVTAYRHGKAQLSVDQLRVLADHNPPLITVVKFEDRAA